MSLAKPSTDMCKELEEVKQQISKTIDEAIKRLYDARDRLAKGDQIWLGGKRL